MTSQTQPTVALNDGAAMPQFGLGVFQTPPDETERVVRMAVDEGYRLVDTASMYRNEDGVGEALARPDRRLRDDETRQFGSRLRRSDARV